MTNIDYTQFTDQELASIPNEVWVEQQRRYVYNNAEKIIRDANTRYLDAAGIESGDEWVQPTGAHDSYPLNWIVTHDGKTWQSLIYGNVFEPGTSSWREYTTEEWPVWMQPTGASDAYDKGAKVSHVEKHWVSDVDDNVWEPGVPGTETLWLDQTEHPIENPPPDEYPEWVQPTGAQDDYDQGAKVSHNSKRWTSDVNGNVWEPGVYGWTEVAV